jgi:hypothetical protein
MNRSMPTSKESVLAHLPMGSIPANSVWIAALVANWFEFRRWFDNSAGTGVVEPADGGTAERDRPAKRNGALPGMSSQGICLRLASWW